LFYSVGIAPIREAIRCIRIGAVAERTGGIYRVCDGWRKGNGLLRFEDVSESDDESDELEDVAVDSSELHEVVGNVDEVQGEDPREVLGQFFCENILFLVTF